MVTKSNWFGRNTNSGNTAEVHDGTDTSYLRGKFCILDIDYQGSSSSSGTIQFVGSSTGPGGRRDWEGLALYSHNTTGKGSAVSATIVSNVIGMDKNDLILHNPSVAGQSCPMAQAKFPGILEPFGNIGNDLLLIDHNNYTFYKVDLSSPDLTVTNVFDFSLYVARL